MGRSTVINKFLPKTQCHACSNDIEKGDLFCKICGRSRGINKYLQFKKFEVIGIITIFTLFGFLTCTFLPSLFHQVKTVTTITKIVYITNTPESTQTPKKTLETTPTQKITPRLPAQTHVPTATKKATAKEATDVFDFESYKCLDKSQVKLRVGSRAKVSKYNVNLRESPIVPMDWDANVVIMLNPDETMSIIGGPRCAHDGTWWKVKTDNGYIGWVRELQPNKILLIQLN